jgi:hypothetical protein
MNTEKLNNVPDNAIIEARWGSDVNYRSGGVTQLGTAKELKTALLPGDEGRDDWMGRERVNTLP